MPDATADKSKHRLGQLERAFDAINALLGATQPLKLTALSEVTGLDASGTLRLLKTLAKLGYVIRDEEKKTYLPSARAMFPLSLYHPVQELRRDANDVLAQLEKATAGFCALHILLGGDRVVIEQRKGPSRLTPYWDTSVKSALHSSASGKLLLSTMLPADMRRVLGPEPYQKFTPNTLTSFRALQSDIRQAVSRGFFWAREEVYAGMTALAAPVRSPAGGVVGMMTVTGLSGQLRPDRLIEFGLATKQAADMLSGMSPAVRALEVLLCPRPLGPMPATAAQGDMGREAVRVKSGGRAATTKKLRRISAISDKR